MSIAQFFGDGMPHDRSAAFDTRDGSIKGWTRADFINAVHVHQLAFGASYTNSALDRMFGGHDSTKMPSYAFGQIIALLSAEMAAGLPHRIPEAPSPYLERSK
jgi:hypothetical protein